MSHGNVFLMMKMWPYKTTLLEKGCDCESYSLCFCCCSGSFTGSSSSVSSISSGQTMQPSRG